MKNQKRIIITILLVIEVISLFLTWKSYNTGKMLETKIENNVSKEHYAFYIKENGEYKEQSNDKFPTGYRIDTEKTICVDDNKEELNNIPMSIDANGNITVTSNRTTYCTFYLYKSLGDQISEKKPKGLFTNPELSEDDEMPLRFTGSSDSVVNNYICFGTSEKTACIESDFNYMYRIIGITKEGKVKVMKDTFLEIDDKDIKSAVSTWENGENNTLYAKLNGDGFLENATYLPNGWKDKIADTYWKIIQISKSELENKSYSELYQLESHQLATNASKIGLPYLSDFYYSPIGDIEEQCFHSSTNLQMNICGVGDSWMSGAIQGDPAYRFIGTLDLIKESDDSELGVWNVEAGYVVSETGYMNVYPTFYLKSDLSISDGDGTSTNPFLIKE